MKSPTAWNIFNDSGEPDDFDQNGDAKLIDSDMESHLEYHPTVLKNRPDFTQTVNASSLYDYKLAIDNFDMETDAFFGEKPQSYDLHFDCLQHSVRRYGLYCLVKNKSIQIYNYDGGTERPVEVSINKKVLAPEYGMFVIEFVHKCNVIQLVLALRPRPGEDYSWHYYAVHDQAFVLFEKLLSDAISKNHLYKNKIFTQFGRFIDTGSMTLDQVCIDDDVSQKIKTNIIDYINSEQLDIKRLNNLPTKRGIIFVGDPGQGKTHVSRALANTLNTTFMVVSRFSQGAQVDSIFNFLRSFDRAVVLFEDIDIYLRDRNDSDNEVLSTFLNQLDGIETNTHLIVILTTNDIDVLDKAIKNRPGRFDCTIKFKSPSIETKVKILQTLCADQIVKEITPEDFKNIIEQLPPTYSPAQLRDFHISTCILAIEKNQIDENKKVILTKEIFVEISNKTKTENNSKPIVGFHNDAA